jgi:hypothetical protein
VSPRLSRVLPALAGACAVAAFVSAPPAPAATPCWKLLLNDWYDGTISNVYPIHCYRDAIKHLPTDIKVYSSAADDINRALQQALRDQKKTGTITSVKPAPAQPGKTTSTGGTTTTTTKKKKTGPVSSAIKHLTPGGAGSFPLPLLILGLLAILLVLAGVGGMLWRRYQGGQGPPPSTP